MKILIDASAARFFLAHGGETTQVVQTVNALRNLGHEVEYARWWDGAQTADIIHSFGVPNRSYIRFAKEKGIRVINTTLFTATCNRSSLHLSIQGKVISLLNAIPQIQPWSSIRAQLNWECYAACDMNVVGLEAEANVLRTVYKVPDSKICIVPLGTSDKFLDFQKSQGSSDGKPKNNHLITTGTITERKRSIELAEMARASRVPICFVGKPYSYQDPYWKKFETLIDHQFVKHVPHTESVEEMIQLLHQSLGYVLYSDYENWCLSAHEAIACGLPILVPDQPWSRELFHDKVDYFSVHRGAQDLDILKNFHSLSAAKNAPDINLFSWNDAARNLVDCYSSLLAPTV